MNDQIKAALLVTAQFSLLFVMLITTNRTHVSLLFIVLLMAAVLLAGWAIAGMRSSYLRISPLPAHKASLVQNGPYRVVRHPMYSSILLLCCALLWQDLSWPRLLIAVLLCIVLLIKLNWEEKLLLKKFDTYQSYQRRTHKIIPFIY